MHKGESKGICISKDCWNIAVSEKAFDNENFYWVSVFMLSSDLDVLYKNHEQEDTTYMKEHWG